MISLITLHQAKSVRLRDSQSIGVMESMITFDLGRIHFSMTRLLDTETIMIRRLTQSEVYLAEDYTKCILDMAFI